MILTDDMASRISDDGLIHDAQRLKELRALPLERKIGISIARIMEWYNYWKGNVYVSFSGGKDSTVLLYLVRSIFPDVPAVFVDTGLEYPEIREFVKTIPNVKVLHPAMNSHKVLTTYGYPIISKEVAGAIYYARRLTHTHRTTLRKRAELLGLRQDIISDGGTGVKPTNWRRACLLGNTEQIGKKSIFNKEKWLPIARDLPAPISHHCCNVMKKRPASKNAKAMGHAVPYIGTLTEESLVRRQAWVRHGCNAFNSAKPTSQPLSFWTEQDILYFIRWKELEIAAPYGEVQIVNKHDEVVIPDDAGMPDGCQFKCSGCPRTGCIYCGFGFHHDKGETRFQRLAVSHPRLYEYCIGGGQWADNPAYDPTASMEPDEMGWVNWNPKKIWVPDKKGLGMGKVFDMCNEIMGYDLYRYE